MLINLNEFINHNTTVNILLATTQNMVESPKCLHNVLIITGQRDLGSRGLAVLSLPLCLPEMQPAGGFVISSYRHLPPILMRTSDVMELSVLAGPEPRT